VIFLLPIWIKFQLVQHLEISKSKRRLFNRHQVQHGLVVWALLLVRVTAMSSGWIWITLFISLLLACGVGSILALLLRWRRGVRGSFLRGNWRWNFFFDFLFFDFLFFYFLFFDFLYIDFLFFNLLFIYLISTTIDNQLFIIFRIFLRNHNVRLVFVVARGGLWGGIFCDFGVLISLLSLILQWLYFFRELIQFFLIHRLNLLLGYF
jgi:hypothetical protein